MNSHSSAERWLPILALVVLSLIWGYTWVMAKQALTFAPPFSFAAQRCVGGALVLLLVVKLTGRSLRPAAPLATIGIGLVQVAGFMLLQTWALVEGGPGKTAVLIFTMPIWTLLLARLFLKEDIRPGQWLAAFCALAGLVLIIEPWDMQSSLLSKFLGVTAALCWAIGTIQVKWLRRRQQVDLLSLTAWQMVVGAVPLTLLAYFIPEPATHWTPYYIEILVVMTLGSTALCWWLWIYILDRVPAWEASLSVLGTPVVAIVSSRWVLDEGFKRLEIAGVLLIGGGLCLLALMGWLGARRAVADR